MAGQEDNNLFGQFGQVHQKACDKINDNDIIITRGKDEFSSGEITISKKEESQNVLSRSTTQSKTTISLSAVIDYQFIPLLSAAASSKDIIESDVMFKGVLSALNDDIRKKEAHKLKVRAKNRADGVIAITADIRTQKQIRTDKKTKTLLKVDYFCIALVSCDNSIQMSWSVSEGSCD